MGRRLLLGVALLAGIVGPGAGLEAAPGKAGGETKFTVGTMNGESTLRAEGRGVTFFKQVGKDRVVMRVEVPRDRVELEANMAGQLRIVRNGKVLKVEMTQDAGKAVSQIQRLTAGSAALAGIEALTLGLDADDRPEARSLMVSYALLHAVRGNSAPSRAVAGRLAPPTAVQVVRAMALAGEEGPTACWAEFAVAMYQYQMEFNDCIGRHWWIPGWTATCGFQYALQGELAFFWLLSCSGGMPV